MPTMDDAPLNRDVVTVESGQGRYGQFIIAGRHVLASDEPESLGGSGTGPNPYELLLAGLGACTAMTIRMYADRKGWPLQRVEVRSRHVRRVAAGGAVGDRFDRFVHLSGPLSDEQRSHLIQIADRCPVSQTLQRGADVTVAEDQEPSRAAAS